MVLENERFYVEIEEENAPLAEELFDFVYDFENNKNVERFTLLKIKVFSDDKRLSVALFCDFCGNYPACTVLNTNKLVLAQFNTVYEINLENGRMRHKPFADLAGVMGVYRVEDGYILHGEMEIVKLDFELNEVWHFAGADIFATTNGERACTISGDKIHLIDFENNRYTVTLGGELVE